MRVRFVIAVLVLAAGPAAASPDKELAKLVEAQVGGFAPMAGEDGVPAGVYLDGATFSSIGGGGNDAGNASSDQLPDSVFGGCMPKQHDVHGLHVTPAADGTSAAVSFTVAFQDKCDVSGSLFDLDERASEVAVKTAAGWRIAGGAWSVAQENAHVNASAKAGTLPALDAVADADGGDAGVGEAFAAMLAGGVDAAGAARKDLIAIGSGPGERTTTGSAFARPWKAAWVGKVAVQGHVRIELAPSGTTSWVTADVSLAKTKGGATYTIPFRLFVVFDKGGGAWSLIHAHLAVPEP